MKIFGRIGQIKKALKDHEIKKSRNEGAELKRIKAERIEYERRAKVKSNLKKEKVQLFKAKNPTVTRIAQGVRANFEKARQKNNQAREISPPYWLKDTGNPFDKKKKKEDNKPYWLQ